MIKRFIATIKTGSTTYRSGLLQAKAYRILKNHTQEQLEKFGITTIDWALLGLLYDNLTGLGLKHIAQMIGVEAPFVTRLVDSLSAQGLLTVTHSDRDRRAKSVVLTPAGLLFVPKVERILHQSVKRLLAGIPGRNLLGYLDVLTRIVENAELAPSKKKDN